MTMTSGVSLLLLCFVYMILIAVDRGLAVSVGWGFAGVVLVLLLASKLESRKHGPH